MNDMDYLLCKKAIECYDLMDQTGLLQQKQALENDLENSIATEEGVQFTGWTINIIDNILEERDEKWRNK